METTANRTSIQNHFNLSNKSTHRIMMNLNYGFFRYAFGNNADEMWNQAHPFMYPNSNRKDYFSFSLKFLEDHFSLFATNLFTENGTYVTCACINKGILCEYPLIKIN